MLLTICLALLGSMIGIPATFLIHRKLRQAKVVGSLKIDTAHGIVEELFVPIGGIDQWISIRGEDRNNPALLVIHGGPGSSYSIFTPHLHPWEKHFTIVQWDQRGAGKTFARLGSHGTGKISMNQLTSDAIELAEYLRERLRQDRIFLLASSMGSTFGLQAARIRPDLFFAYIGTDQNVGMVHGPEENYQRVLSRLDAHGMIEGARFLKQIGPDPKLWTHRDFTTFVQWTMRSDRSGYSRTMKLLKNAVWYAPGWTLRDIRAFVKGMHFSLQQLFPEMVQYNAWAQGTHFELPIFIFQGEYDVLTPAAHARAYFTDVDAPIKRMEMIPNVGHFAAFLQPELFLKQLLDHVRPLADVSLIAAARR